MINIYRASYNGKMDKWPLNVFEGRDFVQFNEVVLKSKKVFNNRPEYEYAEPINPGMYAFGGTFLYTSNGVFPQFNKPIPLHDRDMSLENS